MDIAFDDPLVKSDAPSSPEQIKAGFESCAMTLLGSPLTKEELFKPDETLFHHIGSSLFRCRVRRDADCRFAADDSSPSTTPTPRVGPDCRIEMSRMIPMRDGGQLEAWFFKPANLTSKAPTVLELSQYDIDGSRGQNFLTFVKRGYVYAQVLVRGRARSGGTRSENRGLQVGPTRLRCGGVVRNSRGARPRGHVRTFVRWHDPMAHGGAESAAPCRHRSVRSNLPRLGRAQHQ